MHAQDKTRDRRTVYRPHGTDMLVADNDSYGSYQRIIFHCVPILPCRFYEGYSLGKNAAGDDFPDDDSGANSHYGGQSIWGKIDALVSRYHWTLDYILWGISWANAQLMIADALKTDYKSKAENGQQNTGQPRVPDVIDMDDPNAMNALLMMARGKR